MRFADLAQARKTAHDGSIDNDTKRRYRGRGKKDGQRPAAGRIVIPNIHSVVTCREESRQMWRNMHGKRKEDTMERGACRYWWRASCSFRVVN
jgi:hypothetical protein